MSQHIRGKSKRLFKELDEHINIKTKRELESLHKSICISDLHPAVKKVVLDKIEARLNRKAIVSDAMVVSDDEGDFSDE